jgi:coenzyme F420-reducing hydrogenase gamma subunit
VKAASKHRDECRPVSAKDKHKPMSFAVLQLSGCAGCEVSLLNANEWINKYKLVYMPLVISTHEMPKVEP